MNINTSTALRPGMMARVIRTTRGGTSTVYLARILRETPTHLVAAEHRGQHEEFFLKATTTCGAQGADKLIPIAGPWEAPKKVHVPGSLRRGACPRYDVKPSPATWQR